MSINYAIIGGDLRIVELAKKLKNDGNEVKTFGLEQADLQTENIIICNTLEQALEKSQIIIGPTPFSSDGIYINTPFSKEKISIQYLLSNIENKLFIAGAISPEVYRISKNEENVIDIMKQEELTILNVISTAEGAIEVAMSNTNKILHGSKILIMGFGRIGKILAKKLEALSCIVTCSARKNEDFAWIKAYGYKAINTNDLGKNLSEYDIIINTIPQLILNKERLEYIRKETLLIDLASKPGGIDTKIAKQKGIKTIWALALPGKVAPVTTAEFIKNTIYHIIEERKIKRKEEEK